MLSIAVEYERRKASLQVAIHVNYRGNLPRTWVPAELQHSKLPVNAIAFSICPTYRDLYLEYVEGVKRRSSWPRYVGRVIDQLYKEIFEESRSYCQTTPARHFDILEHLTANSETIVQKALTTYKAHLNSLDLPPSENQSDKLYQGLKKIIRYEAIQISALMEYELARVPNNRPDTVFNQFFSLNLEPSLGSFHHGFTSPATPDFILRDRVIGDIKYGEWKDYFEYTMVAYALAYEDHHQQPMDLGAILQVELPDSRPFPTHFGTRIDLLDDFKRERFIAVRNRKLQIVTEQIDPGRAVSPDKCDPNCDFYNRCWGGQ